MSHDLEVIEFDPPGAWLQGRPKAYQEKNFRKGVKLTHSLGNAPELKNFRLSHGLTQSQIADLLYVPTRRIENWEQGISPMPAAYWELLQLKV